TAATSRPPSSPLPSRSSRRSARSPRRAEAAMVKAPASVEDYLAALPDDQRAALESLRATIRGFVPDATETITYGIPTFRAGGRGLVAYGAFKRHLSLFPMSTRVIEANRAELERYVAGKGTLRFTVDEPLPAPLVETIVRARLAENAARQSS